MSKQKTEVKLRHKSLCPFHALVVDVIKSKDQILIEHIITLDPNKENQKLFGYKQDELCHCSTDNIEKIQGNSCAFGQLVYQTTNVPKVTPAPNEDVPKEQAGRGPTHLASGALVFISLLMKYI